MSKWELIVVEPLVRQPTPCKTEICLAGIRTPCGTGDRGKLFDTEKKGDLDEQANQSPAPAHTVIQWLSCPMLYKMTQRLTLTMQISTTANQNCRWCRCPIYPPVLTRSMYCTFYFVL